MIRRSPLDTHHPGSDLEVHQCKPDKLKESLASWEIKRGGKGGHRDDYSKYFDKTSADNDIIMEEMRDCRQQIQVRIVRIVICTR